MQRDAEPTRPSGLCPGRTSSRAIGLRSWPRVVMSECETLLTPLPLFSVIIPVFDDWAPLDRCLQSLADQTHAPSFEALVVDDGSRQPAPVFIHRWAGSYPLKVIRQAHGGIASARNRGVQNSTGQVLVFVDADSKLETNCLSALAATIEQSPQHNCFQLHLTGDCSRLVGRAEKLRLMTLQNHLLQPDGCIRYLNTSGFAIRREKGGVKRSLFDPYALRAEDTLLLANLMLEGELPLFAANAIVQHTVPLSLLESLRKDMRSAYLEGRTFDRIATMGVKLRVSHRERLAMLWSMWKASRGRSIGRLAWFVVMARLALGRMVSISCACFGLRPSSPVSASP